ncbi:hypothetical protein [Parasediminibacterium sp. JCM 36343]|uniref:DoxX family protein n=1 Tax=Parasediminibacterium sp. JCM 36343 TaxID=3374279 RepID=UPI00397B9E50
MKTNKQASVFLFGIILIIGGIFHFLKPLVYFPFIPDFLPKYLVNYLAGAVEIVLGIGVFVPKLASIAAYGIFLLMIAFLPLHMADVFKLHPAIGSHAIALIRLPMQFLLIWWAWANYRLLYQS